MKVLVACEESQQVCKAFRLKGHEAFSCDIQDCSGGHPEWHIKGDVLKYINGRSEQATFFKVSSGEVYLLPYKWDLIIAHPPCTYLCAASAVRMYTHDHSIIFDRYLKMLSARDFFMEIYNCNCDHICIENPKPLKIAGLPPVDQMIQPYFFGDPYSKYTCLWLRGLPGLLYTDILCEFQPWVIGAADKLRGNRASNRSKTFPGIANAMAEQWG